MTDTGIILVLAYPETVVRIPDERYLSLLRFVGIGNRRYVRAGHAALVLIEKATGKLDYYDFGRYITKAGTGRVRGKSTDNELDFDLKAEMVDGKIDNLDEILRFLATNPKIIHGDGKLVASVCERVDYNVAKAYIRSMQDQHFIRYGVFVKAASNCSRFVTTTLIAGTTDNSIRRRLIRSTWFTPSTVGNVVIANTAAQVFEVSPTGDISEFRSSVRRENLRCFLDRLNGYSPTLEGNLQPKLVDGIHESAQWLGGIGAGAWFELHPTDRDREYRYRKISPYGNIDVEDVFVVEDPGFDYNTGYQFVHYSNCHFFHVAQREQVYKFVRKSAVLNSRQTAHLA